MMKLGAFIFLAAATVLVSAPLDSARVKDVMLEKLSSQQGKAGGLYVVWGGLVKVGKHSIELKPAIENDAFAQGKNVVGVRIDLAVDRVAKPEASFASIGIAETEEEAVAVGI